MNDEGWSRDEVESPCVKLCVLHPVDKVCMGCFRRIDEIANWSRMTPEERRAVMAELPSRRPVQKRRGGRRGGWRGTISSPAPCGSCSAQRAR